MSKKIPITDLKRGENEIEHLENREDHDTEFISKGSIGGVGNSDE